MKIDSLEKILKKSSCNALLISSVANITYLTNYSGFSKDEREAFLLIPKKLEAQPRRLKHKLGYLITDGRYEGAVKTIKDFKLIIRSPSLPIEMIFKDLAQKHNIKRLGIEEDNLTVAEFKLLKKHFDDTYHYSASTIRAVKNEAEITAIQKACTLGDRAFEHILLHIKRGMSEKELAFELEYFIKKHMGDLSFPAIVAFSKNSAIPHHQTGDQRLKTNDIVLLDFGIKVNNYCSDMTRTVFFGKAPEKYKKMYRTVLTSQQKAIKYILSRCHPERSARAEERSEGSRDSSPRQRRAQNDVVIEAKEVDKVARDYIISKGYNTIPHSLGHGIGLEVHEHPSLSPKSKDILKPGMVFSIEPGIYEPGFGGVRIEDLVVLEKTGPRLLTHSPKNLIEI